MFEPTCRFCSTPLRHVFLDLGQQPAANSYVMPGFEVRERRFPLTVRVCEACFLVQADAPVSPDAIFSDYAYFSSFADSWVEHARLYADHMRQQLALGPHSLVVEIASNDGYLLQHFKAAGVPVLGIEPAANVAAAAQKRGIDTKVVFFGTATARALANEGLAADLMAANNVLAHVPDIGDFCEGFAILLKDHGIVTFEFPHLANLIAKVQFDTIYHEHFSYLSLLAVEHVFATSGLKAVDVEVLTTHGGSLRVHAVKTSNPRAPSAAVITMRQREHDAGIDQIATYDGFPARVEALKGAFRAFLKEAAGAGKKVAAYGAAAKGNTFLNACGVSAGDINCVFDRSDAKQGRLLPGSHIPILAPHLLATIKPDYLVILPWNLRDEIMQQMATLREWGGKFVTAIPDLEIHD